jgi:hypothetical protein
MHDLKRFAVFLRKCGPQNFVPLHEACQRALQRGDVEVSAQAKHDRNVVSRAPPFETIEEPKPLLCVGERKAVPESAGKFFAL